MPTSANDLQASLEKHNEAFETLLNLIPPKYYLVQELTDEQVHFLHLLYSHCILNLYCFVDCIQVPEE